MKKLEELFNKAEQGRRLEKKIATAAANLTQLTNDAKQVRTELEGLAWLQVAFLNEEDTQDNNSRMEAAHVFRGLGLEAAASALLDKPST